MPPTEAAAALTTLATILRFQFKLSMMYFELQFIFRGGSRLRTVAAGPWARVRTVTAGPWAGERARPRHGPGSQEPGALHRLLVDSGSSRGQDKIAITIGRGVI